MGEQKWNTIWAAIQVEQIANSLLWGQPRRLAITKSLARLKHHGIPVQRVTINTSEQGLAQPLKQEVKKAIMAIPKMPAILGIWICSRLRFFDGKSKTLKSKCWQTKACKEMVWDKMINDSENIDKSIQGKGLLSLQGNRKMECRSTKNENT